MPPCFSQTFSETESFPRTDNAGQLARAYCAFSAHNFCPSEQMAQSGVGIALSVLVAQLFWVLENFLAASSMPFSD